MLILVFVKQLQKLIVFISWLDWIFSIVLAFGVYSYFERGILF